MKEDEKRSQNIISIVDKLVRPFFQNGDLLHMLMERAVDFSNGLLKVRHFSDDLYLQLLEENAIYYKEWTFQLVSAIASYLSNAGTKSKPLEFHYGTTKEATECQLNYIRNECNKCDFHFRHYVYRHIRDSRATKPLQEYITELIFFGMYSYHIYVVTELIFYEVLSNRSYLGSIQKTSLSELTDTLEMTIRDAYAMWRQEEDRKP